jgi:hypothetical protein
MMDQVVSFGLTRVQRLLQCVEHEISRIELLTRQSTRRQAKTSSQFRLDRDEPCIGQDRAIQHLSRPVIPAYLLRCVVHGGRAK